MIVSISVFLINKSKFNTVKLQRQNHTPTELFIAGLLQSTFHNLAGDCKSYRKLTLRSAMQFNMGSKITITPIITSTQVTGRRKNQQTDSLDGGGTTSSARSRSGRSGNASSSSLENSSAINTSNQC